MKTVAFFILLVGSAIAQVQNPIVFPGAPTGACGPPNTAVNQATGDFYTCNTGSWLKVGPGSGGGSLPIGVANGSGLVSNGIAQPPVYQAKPIIDVRDYAVDCTGSTASDTAITNAIAAGPHILLPQNCIIRLSSNHTYATPTVFEFKQGAKIKPDAGVVVTIPNPPIAGPMQQIFDISNAGSWIIPATGDISIPWYGTDCSETTDASTILNVMTGTQDRFSGRTLVGPDNCHLVVESTWVIKNQESLTVRANKIPGINLGFSISGRTSGTIVQPINKDVGVPLSRAGWTASADSTNTETPVSDGFPAMPASNVLTSPPATSCTQLSCSIWLTCYIAADCGGVVPLPPHYIRIDMGSAQTIAQVAYMPRQDSAIGRPLTYDIQTSTNAGCAGGTGFSSQTTGTWDGSPTTKVANFTPVSARCFEVIGNTSISGIYMAAANVNASTSPPTPWTATADSSESGHPASFLIDGVYDDPTTYDRYWSTAFSGSPGLPHYVIIDMQVTQTVAGLAYTPRQTLATTGFILGYDVQTSTNAGCAGNVGFSSQTTGTWAWDFTTKTATFAPVSARCVKLIANTSSGGNTAAGKSIQLYGATGVPQADAGPVILVSRSGFGLFKGFTVQAQANAVNSNFSGSIQTLNYSHGPLAGGYTSTHNTFEDLYLTTNLLGSSVNNYKGFYIHNDPNQELFTLKNVQVNCQNGYFSYGFLSDDSNADSTYLQNSIINNCMRGIGLESGIAYVYGGNYSTNGGFSAFGAGGATIYELGSGCVAEMSGTVEAEGSGQFLNSGKDQVSAGCTTQNQHFHDNQMGFPDIDPAVYPINYTGGNALVLENNSMKSASAVVHNSLLVGTDQTGALGSVGRIIDNGNNIMDSPNVLMNVPNGGKGFNIPRLSIAGVNDQGYSSYPLQFIQSTGPTNGQRARPSPALEFAGNIFNSIPSTPQQEVFNMRAVPAADGIHSTFAFTERGVTGAVGGAHMYAFDAPFSGIQLNPVSPPTTDGVTVQGTPGSTTYGYKIECLAGSGHCQASAEATTATGPAMLGSPNCTTMSWRPAGGAGNLGAGAWGYKVFRTTCAGAGVCGTTPTGLIGTITARDLQFTGDYQLQDCGLAADGAVPDATNTTGQLVSTVATGLAPFVVTSTTNVANLNASSLNGATFAAPGAIGGGTPSTGAFTSITATSTTPVANLTTVPTTYNHSGTQQTATHLIQDSCTLGTDCGVTLTGSSVFTNSTSYTCVCDDATALNSCRVNQTSGSAFTITGTGTDVIRYVCTGN